MPIGSLQWKSIVENTSLEYEDKYPNKLVDNNKSWVTDSNSHLKLGKCQKCYKSRYAKVQIFLSLIKTKKLEMKRKKRNVNDKVERITFIEKREHQN